MSDDRSHSPGFHETGPHRLPFRVREASYRYSDSSLATKFALESRRDAPAKRIPESLHFNPSSVRLRSPTESSMSSISSAIPDSATTHSLSTLASPISTSYASDVQELFAAHCISGSRPASRICHRHQPSNGTCSTFVNDEDDGTVLTGYPELDLKIRHLHEEQQRRDIQLSSSLEDEPHPISPLTESPPIKEEEINTPTDSPLPFGPENATDPIDQKWETNSVASDDLSEEDSDLVLGYVLQLVYGIDLKEARVPSNVGHQLVQNFVQDISQHICQTASDTNLSHTMSNSSSSSTPQNGGTGGGGGRGGKRKKQGRQEEDGEDFTDGEGSGVVPTKRPRPNPKEDENLRLSCPFRRRNPHRFNVRDHHSCAMTYFPKFAELRQHIVKQHKRDDPSAFVCDRCNRDFATRKELRDHQRLPKELMCDISDHDLENGIDGPTATKLLSRKRASGASPEVQWKEIWNILFPDDDDGDVKGFDFTPVIEHFELSTNYLSSFQQLQASLYDKISNPATLETLATKFHQCFIETLERCTFEAQRMKYTNRSNKRNDSTRGQVANNSIVPRKGQNNRPRPDSGVVMDDGSEESGSILGSGLGHRSSVRTVRGGARRGSSQVPETVREILPAVITPTTFDEGLKRQPSMTPAGVSTGAMGPAEVQAWNNSVLYSQVGDMGLQNQYIQPGMPVQPDYMSVWETVYQPNFDDLGHGFTGFNGQ